VQIGDDDAALKDVQLAPISRRVTGTAGAACASAAADHLQPNPDLGATYAGAAICGDEDQPGQVRCGHTRQAAAVTSRKQNQLAYR
jgi:hypothetical protein